MPKTSNFLLPENAKVAFLLVLYIILFFFQQSKPIVTDEYPFLLPAESLKSSMVPLITDNSGKQETFLAHPPLYIYYLGFFLNLGIPWQHARLLQLPLIFLAFFFLWKLSKEFFKVKFSNVLFILLLMPLFVPGTMTLSIDSALLLALFSAYFYFLLSYLKNSSPQNFLILAATAVIILWAKHSTPLIIFAASAASMFFHKKSLPEIAKVVVTPFVFFAVSWLAYSILFSLNPLAPFSYVSNRSVEAISQGPEKWLTIFFDASLANFILWLNPGIFLACLIAAAKYKEFFKNIESVSLSLILYISLIALAILAPGAWNFPIYLTTFAPFFALMIATKFFDSSTPIKSIALAFLLTRAAFFFLYQDSIIYEAKIIRSLSALVILVAISAASQRFFSKKFVLKEVITISIVVAGIYFMALHAFADYQTGYLYGLHTQSAIEKIKELGKGYDIFGPPEITRYLEGFTVYDTQKALDLLDAETCTIGYDKPLAIVLTDWQIFGGDKKLLPLISNCLKPSNKVGRLIIGSTNKIDYAVYFIKP